MRRTRMFGAAVSVAALLGATAAAGGTAAAATNGVGTTTAKTTVLNVTLGGGFLNLSVLGDNGTANIDPKAGTPSSAGSTIAPLTSTSSVSALNLSLPKIGVSSTGAADNKTVPSISLATPLSTGSISPLSLSAVVDSAQGAASGLNSSLSNVTAVGGLLSVPSATSSLGAAAKPADADGLRGLSIPSIQVLNLGAVLQGLGINPANLQLGQVQQVLNTLGVTVPNGSSPNLTGDQLAALVNSASGALTSNLPAGLADAPNATPIGSIPAPLVSAITALIPGGIGGAATAGDLKTLLNTEITSVLTGALSGIGNAPLLQVNDLVVGISTKAADTVQNSTADIKASLGSIQVGALNVPGVDLASLLTNAQSTVNGILSTVGLGSNLVTVKALDQAKSVSSDKGYVNAVASLTGVHVAIAKLSSVVGTAAAGTDTMGSLFGSTPVPALSTAMATLNGAGLPTTGAGALTDGATVDVLQVGASSAFIPSGTTPANPSAATPANGTLAVTGGPTQVLGFIGLLLLATVAGLRWLRRPATTN